MTYQFSDEVMKLNPELKAETVTPSKYKNVRTESKGMTFASGHEASVVGSLILLEEQKQIFALRLQVRFSLAGSTVYVADAVYCQLQDGKLEVVVVDAKGFRTKEYKIKKKLFREKYGLEITEL